MATLLLDDLAERIGQQEAQLQALRGELETRQRQLADLSQQKQLLLMQLQQIDAQIGDIAGGSQSVKISQQKTAPAKSSRIAIIGTHAGNGTTARQAKRQVKSEGTSPRAIVNQGGKVGQPSLPALIVTLLREAGRPMTVTELVEAVKRRGFRSNSDDFPKMLSVRARELKRKGMIQAAEGQPGFVIAKGQTTSTARPVPLTGSAPKPKQAGGVATSSTVTQGATASKSKPAPPGALRDVLTQILRKSDTPLTGSELAERALKAGYKSTSKDFVHVVWVCMSKMTNVENVPNKGYRLKKQKV